MEFCQQSQIRWCSYKIHLCYTTCDRKIHFKGKFSNFLRPARVLWIFVFKIWFFKRSFWSLPPQWPLDICYPTGKRLKLFHYELTALALKLPYLLILYNTVLYHGLKFIFFLYHGLKFIFVFYHGLKSIFVFISHNTIEKYK